MNCTSIFSHWRTSLCATLLVVVGGSQAATAAQVQGDAMDFPRTALTWFLTGDAEQLWPHAGAMLRELAEDVDGLREAGEELAGDIEEMLGPQTALLDEQVFDHPEGGGMSVYVRTVRHAMVDEFFWVVIFMPQTQQVHMVMPQPRQTIKTLFPPVRLP